MHAEKNKTILVTGITGNQGGAVACRLFVDGWLIRGMTRNPDNPKARALAEIGVEVMKGDFDDWGSLHRAFKDVYGVFALQTPFEKGPEVEVAHGIHLAEAARMAGVKHFVYSSVAAANLNTGIPHFDSKGRIEWHLKASRLPVTVFRPTFFMYNFTSDMNDFRQNIMEGRLSLPLRPDKPVQMIAPEDFAAFVSMAFKKPDEYLGKSIDLAGDELSMSQAAETIGRVIGRPVVYRQTPMEEVRAHDPDMATMFEWLNEKGFGVDIKMLRAIHPNMMDLETWLRKTGWGNAGAGREMKAA